MSTIADDDNDNDNDDGDGADDNTDDDDEELGAVATAMADEVTADRTSVVGVVGMGNIEGTRSSIMGYATDSFDSD